VSEDSSHLFICFSSKDEAIARDVVEFLEDNGMPCWISARDVDSGENYQESIVNALEGAKGIVFLFSENSSQSGETKKELSIGGSINVPVFPVRLSPITPSGALRYELATRQWIDIFPDQERALGKLIETIRKALASGQTQSLGKLADTIENALANPAATDSSAPAAVAGLRLPARPWRRRAPRSAMSAHRHSTPVAASATAAAVVAAANKHPSPP
jgi:hypothetical protein